MYSINIWAAWKPQMSSLWGLLIWLHLCSMPAVPSCLSYAVATQTSASVSSDDGKYGSHHWRFSDCPRRPHNCKRSWRHCQGLLYLWRCAGSCKINQLEEAITTPVQILLFFKWGIHAKLWAPFLRTCSSLCLLQRIFATKSLRWCSNMQW